MEGANTTPGRRIYPDAEGWFTIQPGDYVKAVDGTWIAWAPGDRAPGGLQKHEITEHQDGTITVTPSILTPSGWHGYLQAGIWTKA